MTNQDEKSQLPEQVVAQKPVSYNGTRLWSFQCLIDWLKIREKEGHPFPANVTQLAADIDHSVLLQRLTEGKEALEDAPPLSFSTPWYELIEKGSDSPFEVIPVADYLVINQFKWNIITRVSSEEFIVSYGANKATFRVFVDGPDVPFAKVLKSGFPNLKRKNWKITKLDV